MEEDREERPDEREEEGGSYEKRTREVVKKTGCIGVRGGGKT